MTRIGPASNFSSFVPQRPANAQRLASAFERLSSGQRITKASDDPAGLAVAESLNARIKVGSQGIRNLNDGSSLIQVADTTLGELSNISQRLVELAGQAASGALRGTQRDALDREAQALKGEYQRIVESTRFNGQRILTSDMGELRVQDGFGDTGGIQSSLGGVNGTGTFAAKVDTTTPTGTRYIVSADLNGDGNLDVVSGNWESDTVTASMGRGDGTFSAGVTIASTDGPFGIEVADFNQDGIYDVVNTNSNTNTATVHLGRGDGTYTERGSYTIGTNALSIVAADFNGDGIQDLASSSSTDSRVSILIGQGDGSFSMGTSYAAGSDNAKIITGDFNGDRIADLAVASVVSNDINVLLGQGNGGFSAAVAYATTGTHAISVATADVNNDGNLDLISAHRDSNDATVFLGSGTGTFSLYGKYGIGATPRDIQSADVNGDGIADIVAGNSTANYIGVALGVGDGSFGTVTTYAAGTYSRTVVVGDFNNDGVNDIVSGNQTAGSISFFAGNTRSGTAPILNFSLRTAAEAREALPMLQRKVAQLATQRGQVGAFQSRITVATSTLQSRVDQLESAESKIRDVDVAEETANLVKFTILQQADTAIRAQANQQAKLVLRLLGQ